MARNEEKHAGRLNRLWLAKLDEEKEKKNPTRPGLGSLHSAAEVQKWIPSIKRDIDFYLKQSQVTCYPERQIQEFSSKIESLTKEYKAYVRKLKELQPQMETVPWTERAYSRKHKITGDELEDKTTITSDQDSNKNVKRNKTEFSPISTPLLDNDEEYGQLYGYQIDSISTVIQTGSDEPLIFDQGKLNHSEKRTCGDDHCDRADEPLEFDRRKVNYNDTERTHKTEEQKRNLLNLPYSDSSDDND